MRTPQDFGTQMKTIFRLYPDVPGYDESAKKKEMLLEGKKTYEMFNDIFKNASPTDSNSSGSSSKDI